jgi:CHASE3 domain sensor protein
MNTDSTTKPQVSCQSPAAPPAAATVRPTEWKNSSLEFKIAAGFTIALMVLVIIGTISYRAIEHLIQDADWDAHTRQVLRSISDLSGAFKDAETGQRGYVITGRESYLEPYAAAVNTIAAAMPALRDLIADNPSQQSRMDRLEATAKSKLTELQHVIDIRRAGDFAGAQARVNTDLGKNLMDQMRKLTAEMAADEERLLQTRVEARTESARASLTAVLVGSLLAGLLLLTAGILIRHDIKARIRAEQLAKTLNLKLDMHALELETTNKELEAFCYSVSHDLRAPLRTISGFSDALRDDCAQQLSTEGNSHLLRICSATDRMGRLIDDLLNLSRVSRSEMCKEPIDLGSIARSVLGDLRQADPQRQVEYTQAPNLAASGDARLIRVVLDNLLRNAWKFTSRRPDARIEFGTTSDPGGRAFFVRDNGAGFDMKYADKLFGAFQRLHAMTEYPGTGVGLATAQRIVHRHGGRIWASAQPDQGATFFFTL